MASLEMLRKSILLTLSDNRALLVGVDDSQNRRELAGILAEDVACFIATAEMLEAIPDGPAPEPQTGFGARHVGRPGETVEDEWMAEGTQLFGEDQMILAALEYSETHLRRRLDLGEPWPFNARVDELIRERVDRIMVGARYLGRPCQTSADIREEELLKVAEAKRQLKAFKPGRIASPPKAQP